MNHRFRRRAVTHLTREMGTRQVLDIGAAAMDEAGARSEVTSGLRSRLEVA